MSGPLALAAAVFYAGHGWAVFPCEPGGKRPLGRLAPNGGHSASTDPERLRAWWAAEPEANVGLATGRASGLVVVDLDGEAGERSFAALAGHGGWDAEGGDGAVVRTPGGWHLYLGLPNGVRVGCSVSALGPGVDVRGEGGYVVAPPSRHPSGGRYTWQAWPPARLALAAPWLVARLAERPRPPRRPVVVRPGGQDTPYGLAALRCELAELADAPEGQRNHTLNRVGFAIGQLVGGGELTPGCRGPVLEAALATGLPRHEAQRTLDGALRAGMAEPRSASRGRP